MRQILIGCLTALCCLAIILTDGVALRSGFRRASPIVNSARIDDPIVSKLVSFELGVVIFVDIIILALGLLFTVCSCGGCAMQVAILISIMCLTGKSTIVLKQPVVGVKTAPFLGRTWTETNTPEDQVRRDIKLDLSRIPAQRWRTTALYHFEKTLQCCGANGAKDYRGMISPGCYGDGDDPESPPTTITTAPNTAIPSDENDTSTENIEDVDDDEMEELSPLRENPMELIETSTITSDFNISNPGVESLYPLDLENEALQMVSKLHLSDNRNESDKAEPKLISSAHINQSHIATNHSQNISSPVEGTPLGGNRQDGTEPHEDGCLKRVNAVFEGEKIIFNAVCTSIFFHALCVILSMLWCVCCLSSCV